MIYPNVQIVGATKCGTSTLHHWLSNHSEVCASNPKESNIIDIDFQDWAENYPNFFKHCKGEKIILDANPNLFVIPWAAPRIKIINPKTKIIICLRDPVERLISHWNYFVNMRPGREDKILERVIAENEKDFNLEKFRLESDYVPYYCRKWGNYKRMYLETGCYDYYLKTVWRPNFENIHIVLTEEMKTSPEQVREEICHFLGIDKNNFEKTELINRNVSKNVNVYNKSDLIKIEKFYKEITA